MPRILAINCGYETVEKLRVDSRFEVVEASFTQIALPAPHPLGPPNSFDLVVMDDQSRSTELPNAPEVNDKYLNEAEVGGAVSVEMSHDGLLPMRVRCVVESQRGFNTPVLTAIDGAEAPYIDTFLDRFGDSFGTRVLRRAGISSQTRVVLAENDYEDAIIFAAEGNSDRLSRYAIPSVGSDGSTAATIVGFIDLVVLPIHPELLADQFTPAAVTVLTDEIAKSDSEHTKLRRERETRLRIEQEYYARHAALRTEMNEGLKTRVQVGLQEAFGLNVTDLDQIYEDKNADLWIDEYGIVIEVRGSKRRNAGEDDVMDVVDHAELLTGDGREVLGRVLIFNGQLGRRPQDRTTDVFASGVIREAQKAGVALMTGNDLLRMIELARLGQYETETLLELLRTPGRVQGIPEPRIEL